MDIESDSGQSGSQNPSVTSLKMHSCALCHKRKVKCDKKDPCTYCATRNIACVPLAQPNFRMKKKRFPEAELLSRLRKYEAVLKSFGVDVDRLRDGTTHEVKPNSNVRKDQILSTRDGSSKEVSMSKTAEVLVGAGSTAAYDSEVDRTEQIFKACSEDEDEATVGPIFTTYDLSFETYGSPLMFNTNIGPSIDLPTLHPSTNDILKLWQTYLDNVHPLLRPFHAPSVQQQLFNTINDLSTIPLAMHALLFSVYASAITSMQDAACLSIFGEDKYTLLCRFQSATRVGLHRSGFLRSSDRTMLSATAVCLTSMTKTIDPRSLLCMIASSESCARRGGYHLNINGDGLTPFEIEMRRRLWWQLVWLQSRVTEAAVSGPSAMSWTWQAGLPLNVNESDLHPDMSNMPPEHKFPTDIIFCLVKYEIIEFRRRIWASVQEQLPNFRASEFSHPGVSIADKLKAIDAFQQRLHDQYLNHCDFTIALPAMTQYYIIYSLSKMRLAAYTASELDRTTDPAAIQERQENVMQICIEAIEAYTSCFRQRVLDKFNWFLTSTAPFLAYVHLLFNLRRFPASTLANRGWNAISVETDGSGQPIWIWGLSPSWKEPEDSAMALAFASMTVKAWEARESALGNLQTPALVVSMRKKLANRQTQSATTAFVGDATVSTTSSGLVHTLNTMASQTASSTLQLPLQDLFEDSDFTMLNDWGFGTSDDPYWGTS